MTPSTARQCMFTCMREANRKDYALILPRKNAKPWKPTPARATARNEAMRASMYFDRRSGND